jgi:hypothetical protein
MRGVDVELWWWLYLRLQVHRSSSVTRRSTTNPNPLHSMPPLIYISFQLCRKMQLCVSVHVERSFDLLPLSDIRMKVAVRSDHTHRCFYGRSSCYSAPARLNCERDLAYQLVRTQNPLPRSCSGGVTCFSSRTSESFSKLDILLEKSSYWYDRFVTSISDRPPEQF